MRSILFQSVRHKAVQSNPPISQAVLSNHGCHLSGGELVPSVEDKMREHGRPGELYPVAVTAPPAKYTAALHQGQRDNVTDVFF